MISKPFIVTPLPFPFRGHQHSCCCFRNQPDVDPVPSQIYFAFCSVFSGNMMRLLCKPHRVTQSNWVSHGSHHRPCLAMRCLPTECQNLLAYLRGGRKTILGVHNTGFYKFYLEIRSVQYHNCSQPVAATLMHSDHQVIHCLTIDHESWL